MNFPTGSIQLMVKDDAQNGYYGWFVGVTGPGEFTVTLSSADWDHQPPSSDYQMIGAGAGGGALSTIAVDGSATFGGHVTAATFQLLEII